MFMAEDLLHEFEKDARRTVFARPHTSVSSKLDDVVDTSPTDAQADTRTVFSDAMQKTSKLFDANTSRFDAIANSVVAGAFGLQTGATDMESLFWIAVVYFIRSNIKDASLPRMVKQKSSYMLEQLQTRESALVFDDLITWIVYVRLTGGSDPRYKNAMEPVLPLLQNLAIYFSMPWFAEPEAKTHPFHAPRRLPSTTPSRYPGAEIKGCQGG